eukprot:Rhum_TRINITY_DN15245_c5_g1::Rhum_TRINITY_DN15245_c5_g1_i1::g.146856::m.146856
MKDTAEAREAERRAKARRERLESERALLRYVFEQAAVTARSAAVAPFPDTLRHRYRTLLYTDKPLYRPGDPIMCGVFVLHATTHRPLPADGLLASCTASLSFKGKTQRTVHVRGSRFVNGAAGFQFAAPSVGGAYTVSCDFAVDGSVLERHVAPPTREVRVRAYHTPRLTVTVTLACATVLEGEEGAAVVSVRRVEDTGSDAPDIPYKWSIACAGGAAPFARGSSADDGAVYGEIRFRVPAADAALVPPGCAGADLVVVAEDGGVAETRRTTVRVRAAAVALRVFAEGGALAAGVANGVFVEATHPDGSPAAGLSVAARVAGVQWGDPRAVIKTDAHGRGYGVVEAGRTAALEFAVSGGGGGGSAASNTVSLPCDGAVSLLCLNPVLDAEEPLKLALASAAEVTPCSAVRVSVSQLDFEVTSAAVSLGGGGLAHVTLAVPRGYSGVLRVTVWRVPVSGAGGEETPVAERLVYRRPVASASRLSMNVGFFGGAKEAALSPGATCGLCVEADVGGAGRASAAGSVLSVVVTDQAVLDSVDAKARPPSMDTMLYVEQEVERLAGELEGAALLCDGVHEAAEKAAAGDVQHSALALLLGVQGWRTFAYHTPTLQAAIERCGAVRAQQVFCLALPPSSRQPSAYAALLKADRRAAAAATDEDRLPFSHLARRPAFAAHAPVYSAVLRGDAGAVYAVAAAAAAAATTAMPTATAILMAMTTLTLVPAAVAAAEEGTE